MRSHINRRMRSSKQWLDPKSSKSIPSNRQNKTPVTREGASTSGETTSLHLTHESPGSEGGEVVDVLPKFDPNFAHSLEVGSRVVALCKNNKKWKATIRKVQEKNGILGFRIAYDGQKVSTKRLAELEWVPVDRVVNPIQETG